ncbi:MAG: DUF4175 family protein, partial [Kiloniellales bacterium]
MARATDRPEAARQPKTTRGGATAEPGQGDKPSLGRRLAALHALARLALLWERIWRRIWPAVAVVGLFLIFALFDLPRQMPGWLHLAFLIVFAGALLALIWIGIKRLRLPSERAVRRRLETDSGLKHRPLAALDDELASGGSDPDAVALWQLHRSRLLNALSRIGLKLPRPGLAARDPFALRLAVLLLLVTAAGLAGPEWRERIERALSPSFATAATVPLRLDLWINPPAYTALPPQFLDTSEQASETQPPDPLQV